MTAGYREMKTPNQHVCIKVSASTRLHTPLNPSLHTPPHTGLWTDLFDVPVSFFFSESGNGVPSSVFMVFEFCDTDLQQVGPQIFKLQVFEISNPLLKLEYPKVGNVRKNILFESNVSICVLILMTAPSDFRLVYV